MALIGSIVVGVSANTTSLTKGLKSAEASLSGFNASALKTKGALAVLSQAGFGGAAAQLGAFTGTMGAAGPAMAAFALAVGTAVVTLKASVSEAMTMEGAMVGLAKATGLEGGALAGLKSELQGLSTELKGVKIEDVLSFATAGAKQGVAADSLKDFTSDVSMLSKTMGDVPAAELADSLGKIDAVMKVGEHGALKIGSAIDKLGDSGLSANVDIMNVTQRISGAAAAMKLAAPDAIALAAALLDTGTEAEAAAGALNVMMQKIVMRSNQADFANLLSTDVETFAHLVKTKPIEAIQQFLGALKKLDAATQGEFLSKIGIEGIRGAPNVQKLAQQVDTLGKYVGLARSEFTTMNQAQASYAKYATLTDSSLVQLTNQFKALGDTIGGPFLEPLKAATEGLGAFIGEANRLLKEGQAGLAYVFGGKEALASFDAMHGRGGTAMGPSDGAAANAAKAAAKAAASAGKGGALDLDAPTKIQSLKTKVDQLTASLRLEANTFGMASRDADIFKLSTEGASAAQLKSARAADAYLTSMEKAQSTQQAIDALTSDLKEQAATWNKTSTEILAYKLKLVGATAAEIASATAMNKQLEGQKKAKDIFEETRTPLEKFNKEMKDLQELFAQGGLDPDTANRKANMLAKDLMGSEDKGKGGDQPKHAAALELGSADTYSAVLKHNAGAGDDTGKATLAINKDQLQEQRLMRQALVKMNGAAAAPAMTILNF